MIFKRGRFFQIPHNITRGMPTTHKTVTGIIRHYQTSPFISKQFRELWTCTSRIFTAAAPEEWLYASNDRLSHSDYCCLHNCLKRPINQYSDNSKDVAYSFCREKVRTFLLAETYFLQIRKNNAIICYHFWLCRKWSKILLFQNGPAVGLYIFAYNKTFGLFLTY